MNNFITRKPTYNLKYLCYRAPKSNVYNLANREGKLVGRMIAYPEFLNEGNIYNPNVKDSYSLYIKKLFINKEERGKGAGQALLNIACADSAERRCHGDVHLIAQCIENYGRPPQIFYRKAGFNSMNDKHIEMIDQAIKENTALPPNRWITTMYKSKK